jgi:hypothetical protein
VGRSGLSAISALGVSIDRQERTLLSTSGHNYREVEDLAESSISQPVGRVRSCLSSVVMQNIHVVLVLCWTVVSCQLEESNVMIKDQEGSLCLIKTLPSKSCKINVRDHLRRVSEYNEPDATKAVRVTKAFLSCIFVDVKLKNADEREGCEMMMGYTFHCSIFIPSKTNPKLVKTNKQPSILHPRITNLTTTELCIASQANVEANGSYTLLRTSPPH